MNKRQKIIVSITGIFLVLLILIGLTYAYFLTRIDGNTNTKSISVTTADLKLVYADLSPNIEVENIQPGETVYTKSFTVTNEGNARVTNYQVYLENVVNELNRKDDLVYTLTCSTNDTVNSPCTNEIENETTYPSVNGTLVQNSIDVGDIHTYTFTLKYKEAGVDQSEDMGKVIGGKFNIYDQNDLNTLTLGHYILNNGAMVQNYESVIDEELCNELYPGSSHLCSTSIRFTKETDVIIHNVSNENIVFDISPYLDTEDYIYKGSQGLYTTEDDYGTSYYYRGAVINNYVSFAGFTWRIVRINGDGSIRLILNDVTSDIPNPNGEGYAGNESAFSELRNDNAYMGYTYGTPGSDNYDDTHNNTNEETTNDSTIKGVVDLFYTTYLSDYEKYISDTMFCGDKSLASTDYATGDDWTYINTALGYGANITYYAAGERLDHEGNGGLVNPTLKCASNANNSYSRYTVEKQTINENVDTNGSLDYPIGLLSGDEWVMAGGMYWKHNDLYYLKSNNDWWTMTPDFFVGTKGTVVAERLNDSTGGANITTVRGVRPVINLNDITIKSGDGTIKAPYILKSI